MFTPTAIFLCKEILFQTSAYERENKMAKTHLHEVAFKCGDRELEGTLLYY